MSNMAWKGAWKFRLGESGGGNGHWGVAPYACLALLVAGYCQFYISVQTIGFLLVPIFHVRLMNVCEHYHGMLPMMPAACGHCQEFNILVLGFSVVLTAVICG